MVRYVGKTSGTLARRLRGHIAETKRYSHLYKSRWIAELLREGFRPSIRLLEEVAPQNWEEREKFWIKQFPNLTNAAPGGAGCPTGTVRSSDYIERMRTALRGRIALENQGERNKNARLTEADVREIRRLKASGMTAGQIATQFQTSNQNVWLISTNKAWRHISQEVSTNVN